MRASVALPAALLALLAGQAVGHRDVLDAKAMTALALAAPPFKCPTICMECCKAENTAHFFGLGRVDTGAFKCIIATADMANAKKALQGRTCEKPHVRESDPSQAKIHCKFSEEEQKHQASGQLRLCTYEKSVKTYKEFLANSCSLNSFSASVGLELIGEAIDSMYLTVHSKIGGGVCGVKSTEFTADGMFAPMCEGACTQTSKCPCISSAKDDMCRTLTSDLATGRQDRFTMAVWAGAAGKLLHVDSIAAPESGPQVLRKFMIPGWTERQVAYEAPTGDFAIDLAGGGFMCMMQKLQAVKLDDKMTTTDNHFITDLMEPGLGKQTGMAPRNPSDILTTYFERYGVYQQPTHFVVPPEELLSDKSLERLVFESVGAHRLELLLPDGSSRGLNPMIGALPAVPGLEGAPARFAVRLEGLFEDLPLRQGMARWGGNAFFGADGKLLGLQYRGETLLAAAGDARWEYFKFVFRSSLVSTVTAFDHLVATHILVSETLALATVETLPPEHGLRLLLTPHIFKTLAINFKAANNLFPRNMLVHRASPWGDDAFQPKDGGPGLLWRKSLLLRYTKFEELREAYEGFRGEVEGMPELPFFEDGMLLHEALRAHVDRLLAAEFGPVDSPECSERLAGDEYVQKFVDRFFDLSDPATPDFWPKEFRNAGKSCQDLSSFLTECIFLVSGWHRHVGTVPDFFRDTRFAATAWKDGETMPRPKHTLMMMLLAATTNAELPTLTSDPAQVFKGWPASRVDFPRLAQELQAVQEAIDERNRQRQGDGRLAFRQMEPALTQWGVMV